MPTRRPAQLARKSDAQIATAYSALVESVSRYATKSRANRTRAEYGKQWTAFMQWCELHDLCPLPAAPETVAAFLAARADEGKLVATIALALSAICQAHRLAGHESPRTSPLVLETWKGIRRQLGVAPRLQKNAVAIEELRRMLDALPTTLAGARDRALLTVGFAGAFRRSELVALELGDVTFVGDGVELFVRRSKTDQEGKGLVKRIAFGSDPATCPVRSLQAWIDAAGLTGGPLFRAVSRHERIRKTALSNHSVALIIKRAALAAGLDPERLSGHSLRAGFVTEARRNGADDAAIMDQTGHVSIAMVQLYHRRADKWKRPASARLGL